MPAPRNSVQLLFAVALLSALVARAADNPPADTSAPSSAAPAPSDTGTAPPSATQPAPSDQAPAAGEQTAPSGQPSTSGQPAAPAVQPPATGTAPAVTPAEREEIRREVMDEVKRELEANKGEDVYAEAEADARNYDAATLKELQQTVNLLQLHGYFRLRGDLFNKADLGRGADPTGATLFPVPGGTSYLGAGNMRLRLNPVLRVSDFITLHSQIDVLDNVVFGGNPFIEPFFPGTPPTTALANQIGSSLPNQLIADLIHVKRVWAEIQLPVGQLAFGRMGYHWGEGFFYNDGNCFDCDYGNTFDRIRLSSNEIFGHVFTLTGDLLDEGPVTNAQETAQLGRPIPLQQIVASYRFGFQIQRILSDADRKRKLDNDEWAVQYGLMGAYRQQGYVSVNNPVNSLQKVDAHYGEGDVYFRGEHQKLKLATELAVLGGEEGNRLFTDPTGVTTAIIGQPLTYLQGAALLRGRQFFLKQDSLSVGLDLGWASGDKQPGMGIRTYRSGSQSNGATIRGDIDGPKYSCTSVSCQNADITNFRVNPDFRIDELMWRNLFTQITGAYFARAQVGFKPGGRASGGASDYGLDLNLNLVYSQAVYASETPSGYHTPLGFEIDAGATYSTPDGFIAGVLAGFLIPLSGLDNTLTGQSASLGQVYRGFLGVQF